RRLNSEMSPVTLRMKMIKITIAPMASNPTRSSETVVLFLAITTPGDESKLPEEIADVRVVAQRQLFVGAAEDDLAFLEHDELGVDEAKAVVFAFEFDLAVLVDGRVVRRQQLDVFEPVRDEDRADALQVAQLHGQLQDRTRRDRVEPGGRLVEQD